MYHCSFSLFTKSNKQVAGRSAEVLAAPQNSAELKW
jgi:hypothetical protein